MPFLDSYEPCAVSNTICFVGLNDTILLTNHRIYPFEWKKYLDDLTPFVMYGASVDITTATTAH